MDQPRKHPQMNRSDEELDKDWKPNGRRPQSTIARSFSQELGDIFRIENSVADLDENINKRKQQVTSQTSELEALEARIREMEARLKGQTSGASAASSAKKPASPKHPRVPVSGAFGGDGQPAQPESAATAGRPGSSSKYAGSRPGTARASQQAVPGALPPTPTASEGEYTR